MRLYQSLLIMLSCQLMGSRQEQRSYRLVDISGDVVSSLPGDYELAGTDQTVEQLVQGASQGPVFIALVYRLYDYTTQNEALHSLQAIYGGRVPQYNTLPDEDEGGHRPYLVYYFFYVPPLQVFMLLPLEPRLLDDIHEHMRDFWACHNYSDLVTLLYQYVNILFLHNYSEGQLWYDLILLLTQNHENDSVRASVLCDLAAREADVGDREKARTHFHTVLSLTARGINDFARITALDGLSELVLEDNNCGYDEDIRRWSEEIVHLVEQNNNLDNNEALARALFKLGDMAQDAYRDDPNDHQALSTARNYWLRIVSLPEGDDEIDQIRGAAREALLLLADLEFSQKIERGEQSEQKEKEEKDNKEGSAALVNKKHKRE